MDKRSKIVLTVALGIVGIGASTLYFAPQDMPFWAEASKWLPGIVITILAFLAADTSANEARGSRVAGERAELEARESRNSAARAEQVLTGTRKQRREIRKEARRSGV